MRPEWMGMLNLSTIITQIGFVLTLLGAAYAAAAIRSDRWLIVGSLMLLQVLLGVLGSVYCGAAVDSINDWAERLPNAMQVVVFVVVVPLLVFLMAGFSFLAGYGIHFVASVS